MRYKDQRKKVDLLITLLISYFFILLIICTLLDFSMDFKNYILLTILMVVGVLSYYFNVTIALISTLIVDFIVGTYSIYQSVFEKVEVNTDTYIWILLIPITSLLIAVVAKNILILQNRLTELENINNTLATVDSLTGDGNTQAFIRELPIYLSMNKRYDIPVTIMVVRVKHSNRLKNILGKSYLNGILVESSKAMRESLRIEDKRYVLSDDMFAYILISSKDGSKIVKDRLKDSVKRLDVKNNKFDKSINIELQIGSYYYDGESNDPLEIIDKAEKELEYDL